MKKITAQSSSNINECVELILRGASKRRRLAYAKACEINSNAGIKANLSVVK